jgi:hypothetical protein
MLIEARMKAAQRIKAYQRKNLQGKYPYNPKALAQCIHGSIYQISKNAPEQGYEKPKLELIHPRLPKIAYRV